MYNGIGNIERVIKNGVTTQFGYDTDYPDRLTSYGSKTITYNSNGGVSSYDGWDYTWTRGRLSSIRKSSGGSSRAVIAPVLSPSRTYSFTYNAFGQRTGKSYSYFLPNGAIVSIQTGETTYYNKQFKYDASGRLIAEMIEETQYGVGDISKSLKYLYDESGMIGVQYTNGANTSTYYYLRNLQGDVIGIYNTSGAKVVGYTYDAWGNCTIDSSTTNYDIAHDNPIRYRGYYYDEDTGLYYLNARYYSPEWRRFISPDDTSYLDPENVNGLNLYYYCNNDPINYADPSGHLALSTVILIIMGVAAVNTIGNIIIGNIMDVPIVLDFSGSLGAGAGIAVKAGISLVLDFKNDSFGFYPHYGFYFGAKANAIGGSYATGFISNYQNEGDYQGPFIDFGGGFLAGVDHCYDPRYPYDDTVRATSSTYGNGKGVYFGYDYYGYWGSIPFWTE